MYALGVDSLLFFISSFKVFLLAILVLSAMRSILASIYQEPIELF
jgi:hypothetical protein